MTRKYRITTWIFAVLSFLCFFAPPAFFVCQALLTSTLAVQKIALCSTVMAVIIMTIVAAVNKIVLRSRIWILLIGLWICLDNFMLPIIVIAITQIADETVFTPLHNYFKTRLVINKQIDGRIGKE